MSDRNLLVSVIVQAVDKASKTFRNTAKETTNAGRAAEAAQRRLNRLGSGTAIDRYARRMSALNRLLQSQERRLRAIDRVEQRIAANRRKMGELRGRAVSTAAMAAGALAPVVTAAGVEQSELRLRTAINTDPSQVTAAMAAARKESRRQARLGLVGYIESNDIQYALNSAELEASAARVATGIVAKLAKVTRAMPEQAAEVLAGTYNNMAKAMGGTTEEKLGHIADILTATQIKYQIRNFGQLGEGISYAAASAAGAKIPLNQLAATIGLLNSSQVTGSRAGTAFSAVERNLMKASRALGFEIVRAANGQMDFVATLQDLRDSLDVYDSLDEKNAKLQELFGEEGRAGIVPLLEKLDQLKAGADSLNVSVNGYLDAKAKLFSESTAVKWAATVGAVHTLADSFGRALLPAVNAVLAPTIAVVSAVADLAEKYPNVTAAIGMTIGGLVALRAAMLAARLVGLLWNASALASTLGLLRLGGAIPAVVAGVRWLAGGLLGLAVRAVPVVLAGVRAISVAMMANPIGAIVGGLAIAAAYVIANWGQVKQAFLTIWEPIKPYWEKFAAFIAGIWAKVLAPMETLKKVGSWFAGKFGGGGTVQAVRSTAARMTEPARKTAAAVIAGSVAVTAPAAAATAAPTAAATAPARIVHQKVELNIHPPVGMDTQALARDVHRILVEQQEGALHE